MKMTVSGDSSSLTGAADYMSRNNPGYIDDGCDWTMWLVWAMRERYRIRTGEFLLPPRPQRVAEPVVVDKEYSSRKRRNRPRGGGDKA